MKKIIILLSLIIFLSGISFAQDNDSLINEEKKPPDIEDSHALPLEETNPDFIFDDKIALKGYILRYQKLTKNILMAMIQDETLSPYKTAAAVRVFNEKYISQVVSREKRITERILLRRLNHANSPFVQVEIMYALCNLDRYRYFESMVPALVQKMDHYNTTVDEIAFYGLEKIVAKGQNRTREARLVFNQLRKMLFLMRKRLEEMKEPGDNLKRKLKLLRWSIKVLGTEELNKLPKEVIPLL